MSRTTGICHWRVRVARDPGRRRWRPSLLPTRIAGLRDAIRLPRRLLGASVVHQELRAPSSTGQVPRVIPTHGPSPTRSPAWPSRPERSSSSHSLTSTSRTSPSASIAPTLTQRSASVRPHWNEPSTIWRSGRGLVARRTLESAFEHEQVPAGDYSDRVPEHADESLGEGATKRRVGDVQERPVLASASAHSWRSVQPLDSPGAGRLRSTSRFSACPSSQSSIFGSAGGPADRGAARATGRSSLPAVRAALGVLVGCASSLR